MLTMCLPSKLLLRNNKTNKPFS